MCFPTGALDSRKEPLRCVVLDFDGTLTDSDRHAEEFFEASREELAASLGAPRQELASQWLGAWESLQAESPELPWVYNGHGVCPALGDPYLIANSIVLRVLRNAGVPEEKLSIAVHEVHKCAYTRVPPPFRADAREALERIVLLALPVFVVTNSHGQTVERLLEGLAPHSRARLSVRGHAQKFYVGPDSQGDPAFVALPETLAIPGHSRPVLLKRGRYFDALRAVCADAGVGYPSMLVAGDLFELDLAMPAALGALTHLVQRAGTMERELRGLSATRGGGTSKDLVCLAERCARLSQPVRCL
jgi:phosphoglycolate phosphatase-like HAD superfamily hydrolase